MMRKAKKTRKGKRREEGRSGKSLVNGLDPTRALRNVLGGAVITSINENMRFRHRHIRRETFFLV